MSTEDLCGLKALEAWAKRVTSGYRDVQVRDLSSSWKDGLAFCAIVHYFRPELIDFDSLSKENVLENNQLAFKICEKLGVLALLDAEDMAQCRVPDRNSIALYLSEVYECFEGSKNKPKAALYRRSFSGSSTGSNGSSAPPSLPSTPEPPMPPPRRSIANKRVNSVKF